MPVDNWLILALIMIFSSIIFCALLPMVVRLLIARKRYHRYRLDLQAIACSTPDEYLNLQSIYAKFQLKNAEEIDSHENLTLCPQIPFIDDLSNEDETSV